MVYLFLKKICQTALLSSVFLLIACSSTPVSMQLQPELSSLPTTVLLTNQTPWKITSQDHRVAQYLIEISKGDGVATLVSDTQNSRLTIEQALLRQWQKNGLLFNNQSNRIINIQVIELLAKIEETTFAYNIDTNIVINVQLQSQGTLFDKKFTSHATQEAPFNANLDKTGTQLTNQLSQLLDEIIKDPELNNKLQQL